MLAEFFLQFQCLKIGVVIVIHYKFWYFLCFDQLRFSVIHILILQFRSFADQGRLRHCFLIICRCANVFHTKIASDNVGISQFLKTEVTEIGDVQR